MFASWIVQGTLKDAYVQASAQLYLRAGQKARRGGTGFQSQHMEWGREYRQNDLSLKPDWST